MKFWDVTFTHTESIEAETESEAKEILVDLVKGNAEVEDCDAFEIDEDEYNADVDGKS